MKKQVKLIISGNGLLPPLDDVWLDPPEVEIVYQSNTEQRGIDAQWVFELVVTYTAVKALDLFLQKIKDICSPNDIKME